MTVEEVLASQDEAFPKAIVALKPVFVRGKPLSAMRGCKK
jgi:hypothetical protein